MKNLWIRKGSNCISGCTKVEFSVQEFPAVGSVTQARDFNFFVLIRIEQVIITVKENH